MWAANVSVALIALQLWSVSPATSTATLWVIGLDPTRSVMAEAFGRFVIWNRQIVLPLTRPGDIVVIKRVDHRPERPTADPVPFVLDTRMRQFTSQVLDIDGYVRDTRQAGPRDQTDLGALFVHFRASIDQDRQTNQRRQYVLAVLSDGKPDGVQSRTAATTPLPSGTDYRIVILGADDGTEPMLRTLAARSGFDDAQRMLVVGHALVDQQVAGIHKFLGHRPNAGLEQALRQATSIGQTGRQGTR